MVTSLIGPNLFAKRRELQTLLGSSPSHRIYGADGVGVWYEQLGQGDLFGQSPVLVADRIFEDLPKRDQDILAEYLQVQGALESDQLSIFLVEDEKMLGKSSLGSLLLKQNVLQFPKPNPSKLGIWVQQEAERLGVAISKSVAYGLVERLGTDQYALQTELERWSLHEPAEITSKTLEGLTPLVQDVDAFGLTTAWEQKNAAKVLDILLALRRQSVADQLIIGMLGWKLESLLLAQGKQRKTGKWTIEDLKLALISLYEYDLAVKRGKIEPEIGLELWLIESMRARDGAI